MPAPDKYAIRKSQSVGGFSPSGLQNRKVKAKETPSLKSKLSQDNHIINEDESDNDETPVASPVATPVNGRKKNKLGSLFKWFRHDSNSNGHQNSSNHQNTVGF